MSYFFPKPREDLIKDIRTALAWGYPDHECIGYSRKDYHKLLNEILKFLIKEDVK